MGFFSDLFGFGPKVDYAELILNGAKVIDVRSVGEFKTGHPNGAINIPLETLSNNLNKLKKHGVPIIMVCKSGMRSGQAVKILKSNDIEAFNAGAWSNLT
jgi:rhodanese-related sulfurtransferase|tara:strand:+ start:214 stop:513 length:300 start_codon:yes stop_codon:yes gene_type:complete